MKEERRGGVESCGGETAEQTSKEPLTEAVDGPRGGGHVAPRCHRGDRSVDGGEPSQACGSKRPTLRADYGTKILLLIFRKFAIYMV